MQELSTKNFTHDKPIQNSPYLCCPAADMRFCRFEKRRQPFAEGKHIGCSETNCGSIQPFTGKVGA